MSTMASSSEPASPDHENYPDHEKHPSSPSRSLDNVQDTKIDNSPVVADAQNATSDATKVQPSKETEWVSGLKLWLLMTPLCFTFFLVLLDISIIATVSLLDTFNQWPPNADYSSRPFPRSPTSSTP
jgi:hypothetical protein